MDDTRQNKQNPPYKLVLEILNYCAAMNISVDCLGLTGKLKILTEDECAALSNITIYSTDYIKRLFHNDNIKRRR